MRRPGFYEPQCIIVNVNKRDYFAGFVQVNVGDNRAAGAAGRGGPSTATGGLQTGSSGPDAVDGKTQARRVDKISRKLFPTAFTVFNAFYWSVYVIPYSQEGVKD